MMVLDKGGAAYDLVLFLFSRGYDDVRLLNPYLGAYRFPDSNESTLTLNAHVELEDIIAHNSPLSLRLTIEDLQQLAQNNFGDRPREVLTHSGARPIHPAIWLLLLLVAVITVIMIRGQNTKRQGK